MKVRDIMTGESRTCSPDITLAAAAALMIDGDCGILPVMEGGKLGVVTDRDMYIALATRNARVGPGPTLACVVVTDLADPRIGGHVPATVAADHVRPATGLACRLSGPRLGNTAR